jgi:serine/threonine protein kinase
MDKIYKYEPLWGDWLIDEKLGEGSYGKVYRIRREIKGSTFFAAVKIITIPQNTSEISALSYEGMSSDSISLYFQQVLDGLVEEIELLYSFRGLSNIVNIDDYKVIKHDDNITYDILIKMELLKDLSSYVQSNPLSKSDVLRLAIDMCKALEACHKKNIIHRDIKPDNIFISDHGDYKLGDFGVARKMEKTLSGLSKKGTYLYMAPEVYKGENYDHTVDIYSLGIVIYRYLNGGKLPFFESNQVMYRQREEALAKRLRGEPLPYPESGQGEFESIIIKACSNNPKERYQNIKEFKDKLDKVVLSSIEAATITSSSIRDADGIKTDPINTGEVQMDSKTDIVYDMKESNPENDNVNKTFVIPSAKNDELIDFSKTSVVDSDFTIESSIKDLDEGTQIGLPMDESELSKNLRRDKRKRTNSNVSLNRKTRIALLFFLTLVSLAGVALILSQTVFKNDVMYYLAKNHFDNARYEEASEIFGTIRNIRNSIRLKNEADYMIAKNFYDNSLFEEAAEIFRVLAASNLKDSDELYSESIYQIATRNYTVNSSNEIAKEYFQLIEDYKDSHEYIVLIDDYNYSKFYESCMDRNGYVSFNYVKPALKDQQIQPFCYRPLGSYLISFDAGVNVLELYNKLELFKMDQLQYKYLFFRIFDTWSTSDKKVAMSVGPSPYDGGTPKRILLMFEGLNVIEEHFPTNSPKILVAQNDIGFYIRDNKLFSIYNNGRENIEEEYFNIEFIDENTIKLINKKNNRSYILSRKVNN